MKKRAIHIFAFIIVLIMPLIFIISVNLVCGNVYEQSYYAALGKQFDRLNGIDEKKVILVGGSSVTFGMDSVLFEKLYGRPIAAYGLYGTLGTKFMMDTCKNSVKSGDTVIIAPELLPNTYSMWFSADTVWKSTEGRGDIRGRVDSGNAEEMAAAFLPYVMTKTGYALSGERPLAGGVYSNSAIDELGEITKGQRESNIMRSGYLGEDIMDDPSQISSDFIDHVNDFTAHCKSKGAEVCFSFSPVNKKALEMQNIFADELYNISTFLAEKLDCEVISDPVQYAFDYRYFFDTNFHLNDSGVTHRTVQLVRDLHLKEGRTTELSVALPPPPEPARQIVDIDTTLEYTDSALFTYSEDADTGDLMLTGVHGQASELSEIVVPVLHDGKYIVKIASDAFSGCSRLETITIPVGISEIYGSAFDGCSKLVNIRILEISGENLSVFRDTFSGVNSSCRIVLVNAKRADFISGYFWQQIGLEIVEEVK